MHLGADCHQGEKKISVASLAGDMSHRGDHVAGGGMGHGGRDHGAGDLSTVHEGIDHLSRRQISRPGLGQASKS